MRFHVFMGVTLVSGHVFTCMKLRGCILIISLRDSVRGSYVCLESNPLAQNQFLYGTVPYLENLIALLY